MVAPAMRFCPFCSAENADDLAVCQACGRRLPPLPPRRGPTRNAPPTGVQLPNRPAGSTLPPRKPGTTIPPPTPVSAVAPPAPVAQPNVDRTDRVDVESQDIVETTDSGVESTVVQPVDTDRFEEIAKLEAAAQAAQAAERSRSSGASSSEDAGPSVGMPAYAPSGASGPVTGSVRESAAALPPPPATSPAKLNDDSRRQLTNALNPSPAALRREPLPDARIPADRRSREDSKQPLSPTSLMRPHSASQPPPIANQAPARPHTPSQAPPMRPQTPSQAPAFGAPAPPPSPPMRRSATMPPPIPTQVPQFGGDTFVTDNDFMKSVPDTAPTPFGEPPPTRVRPEMGDRPFSPPQVAPIPEIPEPNLIKAAKYAYLFARARWQRRGAIRQLGVEIKQDTEALDQVLGALGFAARSAHVEGRVFSAENSAISDAQGRIQVLQKEGAEVEGRRAEELSKFIDVERERNAMVAEAERKVGEAQSELSNLEGQRRSMRDKRKELERRLKAYLKAAQDHDRMAGSAPLGDQRQEMRRVAEGHRKEAAAIEPDRQEIDRRLGAIDRPINDVMARLDAGKAELDGAKRSLNDAREGHNHRLAELDAEQKRKAREIGLAEGEISRRLVTLGTLVNLNRIEDPQFAELYQRIDRLRGAITARTTEQEKLTAEREAYDRGTLVRGVATIGGAILILIALVVIVAAIL